MFDSMYSALRPIIKLNQCARQVIYGIRPKEVISKIGSLNYAKTSVDRADADTGAFEYMPGIDSAASIEILDRNKSHNQIFRLIRFEYKYLPQKDFITLSYSTTIKLNSSNRVS